MNSCERFELLISLDLDGEATPEERAELERHLESCPDCRACYADMQRIHQTFVGEDVAVPEGFSERLMDRVRATGQDPVREEEKKTVHFPRWRRWGALAACCALAALCMWGVWGNGGREDIAVPADSAPQTEGTGSMDMRSVDGGLVHQASRSAGPVEDEDIEPVTVSLDDAASQPILDEYAKMVEPTAPMSERDSRPDLQTASVPFASPAPETGEEPEKDRIVETGGIEALFSREDMTELDAGAAGSEETAEVEPAEDDGAPEPGIVTAFGSAAQDWVENVLGLPWASGGSYPLTAEQYGDLLRTLDEAGEPYRVEPGDCYGLLTE